MHYPSSQGDKPQNLHHELSKCLQFGPFSSKIYVEGTGACQHLCRPISLYYSTRQWISYNSFCSVFTQRKLVMKFLPKIHLFSCNVDFAFLAFWVGMCGNSHCLRLPSVHFHSQAYPHDASDSIPTSVLSPICISIPFHSRPSNERH